MTFKIIHSKYTTIKKFFKLGLISLTSITEHMENLLAADKEISKVLKACSLHRKVITSDRENFKLWTENWDLPLEVILYAAELSQGKYNPISYMHKILLAWHEKGIKTLEQAKKENAPITNKPAIKPNFETRSYSNEEMNALFDNLDEVEI